jgi:hypothetical protein
MKLQIDNLDGRGPQDYTASIDSAHLPQIVRKLNKPAVLKVGLLANSPDFVVPVNGARVIVGRSNGADVFAGYLIAAPSYEYLGWGERGPVYRYNLVAQSDEFLLDKKRLPDRVPFVDRSAGNVLRQLVQDLLPGTFDVSGVQDLDVLAMYDSDPEKKFSEHAASIALQARGSYRMGDAAILFSSIGANVYSLNESDANFSPTNLKLECGDPIANDVIAFGLKEPQAYVKDYFVGDNLTLKFFLSQTPFVQNSSTIFNEEFSGLSLSATRWSVTDPASVVSVSNGKLFVAGGTGTDGQTLVSFTGKNELGGMLTLQHGAIEFSAASSGVIGGLYAGAISSSGCLAGFQITPSGSQCSIQALISGTSTGTPLTTVTGHRYILTTRLFSQEVFRSQEIFHSSSHPAGSGYGGGSIAADVRVVLEVHDIDPTNAGSLIAASTVLYDGVISGAPGFCNYALVNSTNLQCDILFTRMLQAPGVEVRSAPSGSSFRTRLIGALSDGSECTIVSGPALDFFTAYPPAANEAIEAHYRASGRALARVTNPTSIAALAHGADNGTRTSVKEIKSPAARTASDCENAALGLFDDSGTAWLGQYRTWSDFLPGAAADISPGDALQINMPSRGANFTSIVRQVEIVVKDLQGEHCIYDIAFANDAAETTSFELASERIAVPVGLAAIPESAVGSAYLASLSSAAVTTVTSTMISIDTGTPPPTGGYFEARWSDSNWGPENDRNLAGRFNTQTFTLPRLTRVQDYFLRQFDASTPSPRYSRYTTALHVDYPL